MPFISGNVLLSHLSAHQRKKEVIIYSMFMLLKGFFNEIAFSGTGQLVMNIKY